MHIVQTKRFPPVVKRKRSKRARGKDPEDSDSDEEESTHRVMLLEYLERGTLHKALETSDKKNLFFPNRVLWHMFHCLIQACITMTFPPKDSPHLYNGQHPPYMERIPTGVPEDAFVHFDIDPKNVLVGDIMPGSDHPLIPLLKLGDFGLGDIIGPLHLNDTQTMLGLRRLAKHWYFTPEQFSAEWEYIPRGGVPRDLNQPPRVAGKCGWKSNLFQVGLAMTCLITRCFPTLPPYPERITIHRRSFQDADDDDDSDDDQDDNDNDGDGQDGGNLHLRGGGFRARMWEDYTSNGDTPRPSPPRLSTPGPYKPHLYSPPPHKPATYPPRPATPYPFAPPPAGSPPPPDQPASSSYQTAGGSTIYEGSVAGWSSDDSNYNGGGRVGVQQAGDDEPLIPEELPTSPGGSRLNNGEVSVWSYGRYLLDNNPRWNHVDLYLRRLVAQCLCDNPVYRPRLAWLEREVREYMGSLSDDDDGDDADDDGVDSGDEPPDDRYGRMAFSDRQIREWMKKCFGQPPAERRGRAAQRARDRRAAERAVREAREARLDAARQARAQARARWAGGGG